MTWFGTVSAWGAVAVSLVFGSYAAQMLSPTDWASPVVNGGIAILLLTAAYRTLRKMSGGLRLLCGAWGLVAGLHVDALFRFGDALQWEQISALMSAVGLVGLALTVLHKETK